MERREVQPLLTVLALVLALAFVCAPRAVGQRERNTCRVDCMLKYQECKGADDAFEPDCRKALEECREECEGTRPKSDKDDKARPAAGNTNAAASGAGEGDNSNAAGNSNGGSPKSGGGAAPPPPPAGNGNRTPS